MTINRPANVCSIERVSIEQIETGDWVISKRIDGSGDPRVWRVFAKRFAYTTGSG